MLSERAQIARLSRVRELVLESQDGLLVPLAVVTGLAGADVGSTAVNRALDGKQDEPPLSGGALQVVQRHAPLLEVVQQGDALSALTRIVQIIEQPSTRSRPA